MPTFVSLLLTFSDVVLDNETVFSPIPTDEYCTLYLNERDPDVNILNSTSALFQSCKYYLENEFEFTKLVKNCTYHAGGVSLLHHNIKAAKKP